MYSSSTSNLPAGRRNSMTSLSTTNSSYTLNNTSSVSSSARDLSTDTLLAMDDKFKKRSRKSSVSNTPLSPLGASSSHFQSFTPDLDNNHAPHTQPHSQPQQQPQDQPPTHNAQLGPPRRSLSSSALYQTANGFRKTDTGTYYFPNGEVFRPRLTPSKRNRPGKLNTPAPADASANTAAPTGAASGAPALAITTSSTIPASHIPPTSRSNSITNQSTTNIHTNAKKLPNTFNSSSRSNSLVSATSPVTSPPHSGNLPRNYSFTNFKTKNKSDLAQSLRSNRLDTPTNISISTFGNFDSSQPSQHQQPQPQQQQHHHSPHQYNHSPQNHARTRSISSQYSQAPPSPSPSQHSTHSPITNQQACFAPLPSSQNKLSHNLVNHNYSSNSLDQGLYIQASPEGSKLSPCAVPHNIPTPAATTTTTINNPNCSRDKSLTTLSDSNPSSLSNYNLNRSSSNTPQTSISALSDDHDHDHEKRERERDITTKETPVTSTNKTPLAGDNLSQQSHSSLESIKEGYKSETNDIQRAESGSTSTNTDVITVTTDDKLTSIIPQTSASHHFSSTDDDDDDDDEVYHSPLEDDNYRGDQDQKIATALNASNRSTSPSDTDASVGKHDEDDNNTAETTFVNQDEHIETDKPDHKLPDPQVKPQANSQPEDLSEQLKLQEPHDSHTPQVTPIADTTLNTLNEVTEESTEHHTFPETSFVTATSDFERERGAKRDVPNLNSSIISSPVPKVHHGNQESASYSPSVDVFCTPQQGSPDYPEPTILDSSVEKPEVIDFKEDNVFTNSNNKSEPGQEEEEEEDENGEQPELIKQVRNSIVQNDDLAGSKELNDVKQDPTKDGDITTQTVTVSTPREEKSSSKPSTPQSAIFRFPDPEQFSKFLNDDQYVPPRGDVSIVGNKVIRKHERSSSSISSFNSMVNGDNASDGNSSTFLLVSPKQSRSPLSPTFGDDAPPRSPSRHVFNLPEHKEETDNNNTKKLKLDQSPPKFTSMLDPPSVTITNEKNTTKSSTSPTPPLQKNPISSSSPSSPTIQPPTSFTFPNMAPTSKISHSGAAEKSNPPLPPTPPASKSPKKQQPQASRGHKAMPTIKKSSSTGNIKNMFKKIFSGKSDNEEPKSANSQKKLDPPVSAQTLHPAPQSKVLNQHSKFKKSPSVSSPTPDSPSKRSARSTRKGSVTSRTSASNSMNSNKFSPKLFSSPFAPPTSHFKSFSNQSGSAASNSSSQTEGSHNSNNSPVNSKKFGPLKKGFSFSNLKSFGSTTSVNKTDADSSTQETTPQSPLPQLSEIDYFENTEDLTLTKLPTIETDNHLFDDVLGNFDEKLSSVDDIIVKQKTPLLINEPFLKDDELTRDQIEDQQKKDLLENLPSNEEEDGAQSNGHSRQNSDEYVDDNIRFLQQELIWPIDHDGDFRSVERMSIITKSNESVLDFGENGEETITVDSQQLMELFNNLSEYQRRNLPRHLKHIRQFKDFDVVEIKVKKFEPQLDERPPSRGSQDEPDNSISILKKKLGSAEDPPAKTNKKVVFSNKIFINETFPPEMYKRYNKSVTQYTLTESFQINRIKNEMNHYKCNEMLVHEKSQQNTHFYY